MKELLSVKDCHKLNNGNLIPCIGFGTYKAAENDDKDTIAQAIEVGYRLLDTASFYGTEQYLGEAIQESGIPREEFYLTSKLWKDEMGYKEAKAACERSLEKLKTDYLDLFLIHWPRPDLKSDWHRLDKDTWRAMEELYREGKVKAIGLSNFLPHHIENILSVADIAPAVNQIEFHPGYTQESTVAYCQARNIHVQAWSPIGRGRLMEEPVIVRMAEQYGVSPAQLCLRFALQKNVIPLPKSANLDRMKQNLELFSFTIRQTDMYRLDSLPQTGWSGEHPDFDRIW